MASRFWVGGTGNLDGSTTTHIAATSGGAGGASYPSSGDTLTLDASSGGGTVTFTADHSITSFAFGAFTGTVDLNGRSLTVSTTASAFSGSGTGTRTFTGAGTITCSGGGGNVFTNATTTNLTWTSTATIVFSATSSSITSFSGGGLTYGGLTINANSNRGGFLIIGSNTITTLTTASPNFVYFTAGTTTTITNLVLSGGSASLPIGMVSSTTSTATITITNAPTLSWMAARNIVFTNAATATNSFDLGGNTNLTVTGPSGGFQWLNR